MRFQWLRHLLSKLASKIMTILARGQITIATVENGMDGKDGASVVYRGEFSASAVYYNNSSRRDVVKRNSVYYIYKGADATSASWLATNWESFGAQFSSVATELLLAENANIGGFIFRGGKLISQRGTINSVESSDYTNTSFVPYITLDGTNGTSVIQNGEFYGGVRTLFHAVNATNCTAMGNNTFKVADKLNLVSEGMYDQQLNILLPNDTSFIGKQVNIHNPIYALTRMSLLYENATIVRAEEGFVYYKPFLGSQDDITFDSEINSTSSIEFMAGTLSFLCVPGQGGTVNAVVRWLCLNYPDAGTSGGSSGSGTGDVVASGTLTSGRVLLGAGSQSVKASSYAIESTLTNGAYYIPTSAAVFAAITQSQLECGNVRAEDTLTIGKLIVGNDESNIKASSYSVQSSLVSSATQIPTSSAVKSYVDSAVSSSGGQDGEWYNIFTRKGLSNNLYTVIENMSDTIYSNANYRIVLLKYRKQHKNGRTWSAPMMSYELYNQGRSVDMPPCAITETNAWWPITGNPTPWFSRSLTRITNVISLSAIERNGKWMWSNVRNKRMRVGVAIYKYNGVGQIGWQRISNIAYVEFYKLDNHSGYLLNTII